MIPNRSSAAAPPAMLRLRVGRTVTVTLPARRSLPVRPRPPSTARQRNPSPRRAQRAGGSATAGGGPGLGPRQCPTARAAAARVPTGERAGAYRPRTRAGRSAHAPLHSGGARRRGRGWDHDGDRRDGTGAAKCGIRSRFGPARMACPAAAPAPRGRAAGGGRDAEHRNGAGGSRPLARPCAAAAGPAGGALWRRPVPGRAPAASSRMPAATNSDPEPGDPRGSPPPPVTVRRCEAAMPLQVQVGR